METGAGPGYVAPDVALLAEFGGWPDWERGHVAGVGALLFQAVEGVPGWSRHLGHRTLA